MSGAQDELMPPPTLAGLALVFTRIALTSFGGGVSGWLYRVFVVDNRWLDKDEFLDGMAVAQALPGINTANMAIWIGYRLRGLPGSLAGLAGLIIPPAIVIVLISVGAASVTGYRAVDVALAGAAAAAVGLPLQMGMAAAINVRRAVLPLAFMVAMFVAGALLRVPLIWAMLVGGAMSVACEYVRMARDGDD